MRKLIVLLSLLCVAVGMKVQSKWQLIPKFGGNITKLLGSNLSKSFKFLFSFPRKICLICIDL